MVDVSYHAVTFKFSSLYMYYKRVLFKSSVFLIAAIPFLPDESAVDPNILQLCMMR